MEHSGITQGHPGVTWPTHAISHGFSINVTREQDGLRQENKFLLRNTREVALPPGLWQTRMSRRNWNWVYICMRPGMRSVGNKRMTMQYHGWPHIDDRAEHTAWPHRQMTCVWNNRLISIRASTADKAGTCRKQWNYCTTKKWWLGNRDWMMLTCVAQWQEHGTPSVRSWFPLELTILQMYLLRVLLDALDHHQSVHWNVIAYINNQLTFQYKSGIQLKLILHLIHIQIAISTPEKHV